MERNRREREKKNTRFNWDCVIDRERERQKEEKKEGIIKCKREDR